MPERRGRKPKSFDKALAKYREQPALWIEDTFGTTLWEKQEEIMNSTFKNRYTAVKSSFSSGKSYGAAAIITAFVHLFNDSIAISTAPSYRQLNNVWGTVHKLYEKARAPLGSKLLKHEIRCGADHFAMGFTTNMPDRLQGIHAPHVLIVEDESAAIEPEIHQRIVDGLMTGDSCHLLAIGNPLSPEGHFYDMFQSDRYNKITITAFETPNIKAGEEVIPGLITQKWIEEKRERVGEDSPIWKSQVLAEFPESSEDTLIPLSWVNKAQERWFEAEPAKGSIYGLDPAGGGIAEHALCQRAGSYVYPIKAWNGEEAPQLVNKVRECVMPNSVVYVDNIGVGWGVEGLLRKKGISTMGVNVKKAPEDPERFKNLRAELYWRIREALDPRQEDPLALPPDDKLASQLTSIKYKTDNRGRIQIESKDSMRSRGLPSPDRADSLSLTMKDKRANVKPFEVNPRGESLLRDNPFGYLSWLDYKY